MRAIADQIEYTATAIYHHFESKEALLSELCTMDFKSLAQAFLKIGRVEDPLERLRRIGAAYVRFAIEHPMHYRLMFMTVRPAPDKQDIRPGDPGEDAYAFLRETCDDAIREGLLRPSLKDADQVAQMMWASMHGLVSLHIVKQDDPWVEWRDVVETADLMCEVMLRGIRRDAVAVAESRTKRPRVVRTRRS